MTVWLERTIARGFPVFHVLGVAAAAALLMLIASLWDQAWIEGHPGTASWVQGIGTIFAVAVAIYLPYRQEKSRLETAAADAKSRAEHITQLLTGDFLLLLLHANICLRTIDDDDTTAWTPIGKGQILTLFELKIPAHFWILAQEVVRADKDVLAPLVEFIRAAEYHNGLLAMYCQDADDISLANWPDIIAIIKENLMLTQTAGTAAWMKYFPDREAPSV